MPYQIRRFIPIFVLLLLTACSSTPQQQARDFTPPVYPPPPAKARFIYDRTLLYSDDVETYTRTQRFRDYATGATRKLRGLVKPFDVASRQGRVYVSDSVQRSVMLFDIPGRRYLEIGTEKPGELLKPLGLALSVRNELYVADVTARRVMVYDGQDGHFLRAIGSKSELVRPSDVALSPDGTRLYVVDTGGVSNDAHHVLVYDTTTGKHLLTIGQRGTAPGQFNLPLQAAVASDGTLFVVDAGNFRVQAFSPDGKFLYSFGSVGRLPGQFARPKGIAVDANDNIYVVDTAFGNVQIFDHEGKLLLFIGERGEAGYPGKYMLPAGVSVDEEGRIYVVDQFFRKVDIYRPADLAPDRDLLLTLDPPG